MTTITTLLDRVAGGGHLGMAEMSSVVDAVMRGELDNAQIANLLTSLHAKGETSEEIAGAAHSLRRHMTPIRTNRTDCIDTCGVGGVGSKLFNVSTSAAIVAASAGASVAKHGNRSVTSKSGSADVLQELGVNLDAPVATVERSLDELGLCFCFAPLLHPAMKRVSAVRKELGISTIFNLLGPLSNPAGAPFQLLGSGQREVATRMAAALQLLGTRRSAVITGEGGLGEATLDGVTEVILVDPTARTETRWQPADFGLERAELSSLQVDSPVASAAIIRQVLAGVPGPARDLVVLNAAAALWVAGKASTPSQAAHLAARAIDTGAAQEKLAKLVEVTNDH